MAGSGAVSAPRLPVFVATLQYASHKVILEKRLNVLAQGPGMVFICGVMQSFLLTSNEYYISGKKSINFVRLFSSIFRFIERLGMVLISISMG